MEEIKISIAEDVYKALLIEKKAKESLSDVILRLSTKNLCIEEVVGTRILSQEGWNEVKQELKRGIDRGRVLNFNLTLSD